MPVMVYILNCIEHRSLHSSNSCINFYLQIPDFTVWCGSIVLCLVLSKMFQYSTSLFANIIVQYVFRV